MTKRVSLLLTLLLAVAPAGPLPTCAQAADDIVVTNQPLPRDWRAPEYPPEAIKQQIEGRVSVEFVVDEHGAIVAPRILKAEEANPILSAAVLEQASRWVFAPANDGRGPVARSLVVPVNFLLKGRGNKPSVSMPLQPETSPTKPARTLAQRDPEYPEHLLPRKLAGKVNVEFQVSREGRVENPTVLFASDAAFVRSGLQAMAEWKFQPATQGSLAVASAKQAELNFYAYGLEAKREDVLKAHGITGWEDDAGLDAKPLLLLAHAPVYPRQKFIAEEVGEAEVEFVVGTRGATEQVTVVSATDSDFGAALAAAVQTWRFRSPSRNGVVASLPLRVKHRFEREETTAAKALHAALKAGVAGAGGLDQRIRPIWRIAPAYPEQLSQQQLSGEATVEFVIDPDGRAQAPRVVSASHDAFGWAAVTAISQWVFVPPTRNGEPTYVRVSIPMSFTPPES